MKAPFLITTVLIFVSQPVAFSVEGGEGNDPEYDLPTYEFIEFVTLPKPTRSPMPKVNRKLVGTTLELKFTVSEKGRPENVRLVKPLSSYSNVEKMTFASQAIQAVSKWHFKPALNAEDKPVPVKVIMPVKVVKFGQIYRALASLDFDESGQEKLAQESKIKK